MSASIKSANRIRGKDTGNRFTEMEADIMENRDGITKDKGNPATPNVPETPPVPDDAAEVEKEPQIPIQQVPMDGICGGY